VKIPAEYFELATSQALKSPMRSKHGAVIFKGKKILGVGYNWPKSSNGGEWNGKRPHSIHCERDALKGLWHGKIRGADILAIRVRADGTLSSGASCKGCKRLLKRKGIRSVYWVDSDGRLNRTWLN
jgi:deoxycytidylate deaminase